MASAGHGRQEARRQGIEEEDADGEDDEHGDVDDGDMWQFFFGCTQGYVHARPCTELVHGRTHACTPHADEEVGCADNEEAAADDDDDGDMWQPRVVLHARTGVRKHEHVNARMQGIADASKKGRKEDDEVDGPDDEDGEDGDM